MAQPRHVTETVGVVRHIRTLLALLSPLALLTWVHTAYGVPFDPAGSDWEGLSDFVRIAREEIGDARVVVVTTQDTPGVAGIKALDLHDLKPDDGVILLHPERTLDAEGLGAFMRHGGRVVLLDDYGTGDTLLQHFGIKRVPIPRRPAETLRSNPQLAIAEPASAHPAVHDVARVVTNHPTGIEHPDLSPVLTIRASREPCDPNGPRGACVDEADVLLAEAGAVGQGRFLAVGDPSIVMNSMLRYPGNKAFARAILRYAVDEDTWGKRGGRVFIAANDFEQKGAFGEEGFSAQLREWQRAAIDALESFRKGGMPPLVAFVLAAGVGLAIILWVGSRATRTHKAATPRHTRPVPLFAQGGVAGHAAVVGAPGTSRVLAFLELKSALEEGLAERLGIDEIPAREALVEKVRAAGLLGSKDLMTLEALLLRMAHVETMALSRRANVAERIRDRDVVALAATVTKLLRAARRGEQATP